MTFTADLLQELLDALRDPESGRSRFGRALFVQSHFEQSASFSNSKIPDPSYRRPQTSAGNAATAHLPSRGAPVGEVLGPQFDGEVSFSLAIFSDGMSFADAVFCRGALFDGTLFSGRADFERSCFRGRASFPHAVFDGDVSFEDSDFAENALFEHVRFGGQLAFSDVKVHGDTSFARAVISGAASFGGSTFEHSLTLDDAIIGEHSELGPCETAALTFNRARIGDGVLLNCRASKIEARQVYCPKELNLQLNGGVYVDAAAMQSAGFTFVYRDGLLTLTDAVFESPATIAAPAVSGGGAAGPGTQWLSAPKLLGLDRVEAANLTLVGLDLRSCRVLDCYKRDQLRIDGPPHFAEAVGRLQTRRQVLADEHLWRAKYSKRPEDWFPSQCRLPGEDVPSNVPKHRNEREARLHAARIQTAYRDLRKGREDAKDEPGAADFYYGEMEMRRFASAPRSVERVLLTIYWAIGGYGLRATRALATLLLVIALGVVGFATVGFAPTPRIEYHPISQSAAEPPIYRQVSVPAARPGWRTALDYSVDSATSLLRAGLPRPLTGVGRVIEIALRLLGPLLLGLAVLALRGRLKR
ncbi:pentapeptide repeat-containing protein [Geodermatophilus sp. SYSU D00710]